MKKERLTQADRTGLSDRRMLDAATDLILEKGILHTSLTEVGEAAGYSRGLAQARFGSKDQLLERLLKRSYKQWLKRLLRYVSGKTGLHAFAACIDALESAMLDNSKWYRMITILWYHSIVQQSTLKSKSQEYQAYLIIDVIRWMEEGKNDSEIVKNLDSQDIAIRHLSFIFGILYMWILNPNVVSIKKNFASYKEKILHEISALSHS
ncbi:MAG: TetR/AcrR family transcriptional regulator [Spirochaetota bacterium]